jgi:hypothetical protein
MNESDYPALAAPFQTPESLGALHIQYPAPYDRLEGTEQKEDPDQIKY